MANAKQKHKTASPHPRLACVTTLLLFALPAVVQAQFTFTTNKGMITITGYTGSGGTVTIPSTTNGYPVTGIGSGALSNQTSVAIVTIPDSVISMGSNVFYNCTSLTNITLGSSVTNIGSSSFYNCTSLTGITIHDSVTSIGDEAFFGCFSLTSVTIPDSVTSIGDYEFEYCSLTNVTIPGSVSIISTQAFYSCSLTSAMISGSVTSIEDYAFGTCGSLTNVYFQGNAPGVDSTVFQGDNHVTVYYLPGTTGWSNFSANADVPTALWFLPNPLILSNGPGFGVQTNRFGFIISWATNISVVVEASTNLVNLVWSPVATNTLIGGTSYYSDPQWTNYPRRFYRISSP